MTVNWQSLVRSAPLTAFYWLLQCVPEYYENPPYSLDHNVRDQKKKKVTKICSHGLLVKSKRSENATIKMAYKQYANKVAKCYHFTSKKDML